MLEEPVLPLAEPLVLAAAEVAVLAGAQVLVFEPGSGQPGLKAWKPSSAGRVCRRRASQCPHDMLLPVPRHE